MTRRDRQLERLRRAKTDVRPTELQAVLERYGFSLRSVGGSHWIYKHPRLRRRVVIPYRRPVKPVYVDLAVKAIDEVIENEDA